jgi:hypothetical protein
MPIEPPEIPPATPGQPTEPPREDPPGNPQPEAPPPMHEPGEPARPDELPGDMPDEFPPPGPSGPPTTPNPAVAASIIKLDPEKHAPGLRPDGWMPIFSGDKRGMRLRRDHTHTTNSWANELLGDEGPPLSHRAGDACATI